MKAFVLGAGGQGGPCASILARDKEVTEVVLGDINPDAAARVAEKIGGGKIKTVKADAAKADEIAACARGADVLFDMVIPEFSPHVLRAALDIGAHYVSTAFDQPFWEELIYGRPLTLDKELKEANLTAVMGCGMAPGFINVITKHYTDRLDTVESVKLRIAKKKLGVEEMLAPWNPGWSPRQALLDCAEPAYFVENGKITETAPYSGLEVYDFPPPIGPAQVTHHAHEEPLTLAYSIGKGLQYCDFKYYLSPQPAAYVTAGLASTAPVRIGGAEIRPIDLLVKLLPKSENAFLNEDPDRYVQADKEQFVCLMSEIRGTRNGRDKTYKIHMPKLTANGGKLRELFGTSLIHVALPAVIAAKMALAGTKKGLVFPEELDAADFLKRFLDTGIPYEWHEM
ncbi:MAG: saccharopine dehydrogenase NADP-binding domain-containing protein [Clostridiales Family XIII bacterium]|jgi:saccharopine dehydrogenase-like NADP-dependent oxidoreductase|nr:saccharopine dehydrogenase NADP-binding domain-containing protein [Clostridiales Family XIII bacterium]